MTPRDALERGAEDLGIALPGEVRERLMAYIALLVKWNASYNLTAVREPMAMVSHHLLDSLALLPHLPAGSEGDARLADVGSGAGLPGIPLALARPSWRVALIEASQKKAAFLRQAKIELGLANVEVHDGRVEELRSAQGFSIVVSRAFAELGDFIAACRHLLDRRGVLAAMKGKYPAQELAQVPAGLTAKVIALRVPFLEAERHLVLCEQVA
jgi:16S rRNA (guanine527-N7)-methyltransferase